MRSWVLGEQRRAASRRRCGMLGDQAPDGAAGERGPSSSREQWVVGRATTLLHPCPQQSNVLLGQGRAALLATLAATAHVSTGAELDVTDAQAGQLRDPEAGLHCDVARSEERRVGKECRSRWSP